MKHIRTVYFSICHSYRSVVGRINQMLILVTEMAVREKKKGRKRNDVTMSTVYVGFNTKLSSHPLILKRKNKHFWDY